LDLQGSLQTPRHGTQLAWSFQEQERCMRINNAVKSAVAASKERVGIMLREEGVLSRTATGERR